MPPASLDLRTLAHRLFAAALVLEVALVLLDIVLNYSPLVPYRDLRLIFNVASEESLADWLASVHMLFVAVCAFALAWASRALRQPGACGWLGLAAVFAYLALDDGAVLHERLAGAVAEWTQRAEGAPSARGLAWLLERFPSYYWQLLFLPLLALAGVFLVAFLWRRLSRGRFALVAAGLACFALAIGLDFYEGLESYDAAARLLRADPFAVSHFQRVLEEYLEMLGMSFLMLAFLLQLAAVTAGHRLAFGPQDAPDAGGDDA